MYRWMSGWAWLWMIPMMLIWIAVLGGVIYAAIRLATRHDQHLHTP
jgi:hypothetical protein